MAAAEQTEVLREEEVGVYNDDGSTVLPKTVRRRLGGVSRGDKLVWQHKSDGTVILEKKDGSS